MSDTVAEAVAEVYRTRAASTERDTVTITHVNQAIDGDLDSLIVAVRALEIPVPHRLALPLLEELRELRRASKAA